MGKSIGHAHPFSLAMLNCQRVYHNISRLFALFSVASPCNPVGSLTDWLAPRARELYRSEVARVFMTKWSISLTWWRPRTRAERRLRTYCFSADLLWFDCTAWWRMFFFLCVCVWRGVRWYTSKIAKVKAQWFHQWGVRSKSWREFPA